MPLFEMDATARGRRRVFTRGQLPFALGVVFLLGMVALAAPGRAASATLLAGAALALLSTLAALFIPWERGAPAWMVLVAVVDLLAVALLRAELLPLVPAVTILAIFPVLWLAYGFPWYGMAIAVFGAGFITSFRFFYVGAWPLTPLEWTNVVTLPTFIVGVAIIVFVAARNLRRQSRRLTEANLDQAAALRSTQDAEALSRAIIDTVSAGVAFYDTGARLSVANARAHAFADLGGFQLDRAPFAGVDVHAVDLSTPIPADEQLIPRALAGATTDDRLEWWGPADTRVAVLSSWSRVRRPDGDELGTVVVLYDVTELAESIEVREQFLGTVSHELRTPLTSITGFLELIDDAIDPADATLRRYVDVVTRRTDDLIRRIGDLFAASEGEKTLRIGTHDIADVVTAAVEATRPFAGAHGYDIDTVADEPVHAAVDAAQLRVAVGELVTNAVKFGEPTAPVTVAYGIRDDRLRISVSNAGPGISSAEQRRAFDRFYRTPLARSREVQGFGLGLGTVRAIAVAHGGTVRIDSIADERTTVTLDLPLTPAAVDEA